MNEREFKGLTRRFALDVIKFVQRQPRNRTADVIGRQLLRAGTSVGANYRAACRARSRTEMAARLAVVEEEADESIYWLELLVDAGMVQPMKVEQLVSDANQITAMVVAPIKTIRVR